MIVTRDAVKELVAQEYAAAEAAYPPVHSLHEGYAILLEEIEETEDALGRAKNRLCRLWTAAKDDDLMRARTFTKSAQNFAEQTACEALQSAAVCRRLLDFLQKEDEKG